MADEDAEDIDMGCHEVEAPDIPAQQEVASMGKRGLMFRFHLSALFVPSR